MKGLVKYLQEIYENCEIPFEVYIDDEIMFKANPDLLEENLVEDTFLIGAKKFAIRIEEKNKNSMKILEFCIKDRYQEDYNKKEKIITQLLQNLSIPKEKIKEVMPQIKEDTFLITMTLNEKLIEALEVLKNIYNDTDIIILNYEDNIILIGNFEDINEHVSSISETIVLSLYEKCYISYCTIKDYDSINELYNENIYKINLGKKYNLSSMIFSQNSLLFEKIMDSLSEETREKVLNNFNNGLSKLDEDMIKTIEVFFKLDLNLSEAAKELYVHRNTLIYRLDKIQKYTGYDIRKFNDAALFKMAFFIWNQKR
ncbi:PucR family transcriptional regulator [Clostridium chromiireducens]|uniref:PucR family transcriptional regulator n=1 Tax=Clostridium chromiireducens TaxID=225345 RepID=A0A964RK37_9CLOT|nr:helix-turn-helix domain-containing protein [Clostridium chromiireducens]MVX63154.1 PucR family transcriptional regulator [Clostridium chromiireducens]